LGKSQAVIAQCVAGLVARQDREGLRVLSTALVALRDFPGDPRYRRLRFGSSARLRKALGDPSAVRLLQLVGFQQDGVGDLVLGTGGGRRAQTGPEALLPVIKAVQQACERLATQQVLSSEEKAALARVPPEPEEGAAGSTHVVVTLRLGGGEELTLRRRFDAADRLSDVMAFLSVHTSRNHRSASPAALRVSDHSQYPPQLLEEEDQSLTLQALGMWPSCRLVAEVVQPQPAQGAAEASSARGQDKKGRPYPSTSGTKPKPSELLSRHLRRFNKSDKTDRGRSHYAIKVR